MQSKRDKRRMETTEGIGLCYNYPYLLSCVVPYSSLYTELLLNHAVLAYSYSGPRLALLLLLGRWLLKRRPAVGHCPSGMPSHLIALFVTNRIASGCKTESGRYSMGTCVYIISQCLRISRSTHVLVTPTGRCLPVYACASFNPFVYTVGTSGSAKGQYAT